MSDYKIEKGIAIPPPWGGRGTKYPWPDMQPGDSVLIPMTEADKERLRAGRGSSGAYQAARSWVRHNRPDWKIVGRRESDAVRIWFVEREK